MDYEALAKKYGGETIKPAPQVSPGRQQRTPELYDVDYSALAKKFGGTTVANSEDLPPAPILLPPILPLLTKRSAAAKAMTEGQELLPLPASSGIIEYAKPDGSDSALMSYEKPKAAEISVAELSSNPENYKTILDFSKARYNRVPAKGETKEEFVDKFLTDMRNDDFNTFNLIASLNYMRNAKPEDAAKTAMAKALYEKTASPFDVRGGGQKGFSPYYDVLKALATDPTNWIGGVVGFGGKQLIKAGIRHEAAVLAGEQVAKKGLAKVVAATPGKVVAAATFVEGSTGVGTNVLQQRFKQEQQKALGQEVEDLSVSEMAVAAILSASLGYVGAKGTMKTTSKSGVDDLNDLMKKAKAEAAVTNPAAPITPVERRLADPVADQMNLEAEEFMKREGKRILDEVSPATPLLDAKIANDMSARAVRVARHIIENDPAFQLGTNEKISTAISNVFSKLEAGEIDDAILEQAISRAGLTPKEFAQANKLTVTEAASIMQQYSVASRALNKAKELDPELKKMVDELFGKPDEYTSTMGWIGKGISRVERESKAFVVSGIGTTVRNVLGTMPVLTYTSAASVIEGSLYTAGKVVSDGASGQRLQTLKRGMADTMRDAFSVYGYLAKTDLSDEVTYSLLEHNPSIRNNILSATQEGSNKELSQVAQLFNSLNATQDAWFRKAIFNAAVEKNARRAGLDPFLIMAEGKSVPASILQKSADDALKATFSYQPKVQSKGINTFEAGAETAGNLFIKGAEFPGMSLFATFPRFMSNAIAFQYRYSIFGAASGAEAMYRGGLMEAAGDAAGAGLKRQGQETFAKGIVGTTALALAYDYRMNHQDSNWGEMKKEDGSTVDMRAIFPIGPLLAVADVMAKVKLGEKADTAGALEAVVGMKMPAGTQSQFLDQLFAAFSSEKDADKMEIAVGKVLGDFTARFSAPFVFKSGYEFLDLFREQGNIQRDPGAVEIPKPVVANLLGGKETLGSITASVLEGAETAGRVAANRVQSKLPILKESLPEVVPRLREGPVVKEGEFFNSLVGIRTIPKRSPAEQEIINVNADPFKVYGSSSGNKTYDRVFTEEVNKRAIGYMEQLIKEDKYQSLSLVEKRNRVEGAIAIATERATNVTRGHFMSTPEGKLMLNKMEFDKLTADDRKLINDRYAKEHKGVTLEEANDYNRTAAYKAKLANVKHK